VGTPSRGTEPGIGFRIRREDSSRVLRERLDRVLEATARQGPVLALEIGCGDGLASEILWDGLSQRFPDPETRLYALDVEAALALAVHRRFQRGGPCGVRALGGDLYHLPLAAERLDFLFALNVLFWADRKRLLAEARRVLKAEGVVFVYDLLPIPPEGPRPLVSFSLTREQIQASAPA
jgi:SAM-dependent methyltransferase